MCKHTLRGQANRLGHPHTRTQTRRHSSPRIFKHSKIHNNSNLHLPPPDLRYHLGIYVYTISAEYIYFADIYTNITWIYMYVPYQLDIYISRIFKLSYLGTYIYTISAGYMFRLHIYYITWVCIYISHQLDVHSTEIYIRFI